MQNPIKIKNLANKIVVLLTLLIGQVGIFLLAKLVNEDTVRPRHAIVVLRAPCRKLSLEGLANIFIPPLLLGPRRVGWKGANGGDGLDLRDALRDLLVSRFFLLRFRSPWHS